MCGSTEKKSNSLSVSVEDLKWGEMRVEGGRGERDREREEREIEKYKQRERERERRERETER